MKFENLCYHCYWKIIDKRQLETMMKNFQSMTNMNRKTFTKTICNRQKKSKKLLFVIFVQWKVFYKRKKIIKKWNKQWKKKWIKNSKNEIIRFRLYSKNVLLILLFVWKYVIFDKCVIDDVMSKK